MNESTAQSKYLTDPAVCCCFTGHRTIDKSGVHALLSRLADAIREAYADGYRHFVTGGAIGFDLLAGVTVLTLREQLPGLTLSVAVPCQQQDRFWSENSKRVYAHLLRFADEVIAVSPRPYYDGCMQKRNLFMVSRSSRCICYHLPDHYAGGTAQTVRMARKTGLDIVNLA